MPTLRIISARIPIEASQNDTFLAVTDWESQHNWIFATRVKGVGHNSHNIGGKLEAFTGFKSFGFLDTMIITKWDFPKLCEVTHTGKVVKGVGLFEVYNDTKITYFSWTEYIEIPFGILGKIGWLFISPIIKLGLKYSLRRFKRCLYRIK